MLFFLYQVILTDAMEGRDVIRSKIDIEIEEKINLSSSLHKQHIYSINSKQEKIRFQ
jgi:hypothetical protein